MGKKKKGRGGKVEEEMKGKGGEGKGMERRGREEDFRAFASSKTRCV